MSITSCPVHQPQQLLRQPHPGECYRQVLAGKPFYFDAIQHCWVAADAKAVRAVLDSPLCQVRPLMQPLPPHLQGSTLGDWFVLLLRQRDDAWQARHKPRLAAALASVDLAALWADCLQLASSQPAASGVELDALALELPLAMLAHLLGLPQAHLAAHGQAMQRLLASLRPGADSEALREGEAALSLLLAWLGQARSTPLLLAMQQALPDADSRAANLLGLLQQTREATAALLSQLWWQLAADAGLRASLAANPAAVRHWIHEVMCASAPVQLSWRHVQRDGQLCGQRVKAGDAVLLWLATACVDAGNAALAFGHGRHRCPGEALALTMASAIVSASLTWPLDWTALRQAASLLPSANVRWFGFQSREVADDCGAV